ncbi:MAG TPA: hypothetical protein VK843_16235 [Planctomycetota bacterium]|nr:hypothetical protein [Planctomycetota bacterium]
MKHHDPSHSALLERIVVGDLSRTSSDARQTLDTCATCRERLRELERLQKSLAAAGEEERAGVARAADGSLGQTQERRVHDFFEERSRMSRTRSRMGRLVALAVAASICGVLVYRWARSSEGGAQTQRPNDVMLNDDTQVLRGVAPSGVDSDFGKFVWEAPPLAAGKSFRLRITNTDAIDSDPLVIDNIGATTWHPGSALPAEDRKIKDFFVPGLKHIEWTVEIYSGSMGGDLVSKPVPASRGSTRQ